MLYEHHWGWDFPITIPDALRASLGVGTCLLQFLMLYEHRWGWDFPITIPDALRASLGVGTCLLQFLMLYEHRWLWGIHDNHPRRGSRIVEGVSMTIIPVGDEEL